MLITLQNLQLLKSLKITLIPQNLELSEVKIFITNFKLNTHIYIYKSPRQQMSLRTPFFKKLEFPYCSSGLCVQPSGAVTPSVFLLTVPASVSWWWCGLDLRLTPKTSLVLM